MDNIGTTARAARLHLRGLYLASTALVGLLVRPVNRPNAPHLASSPWLSQTRLARWLALAIEAPASLLARLNPMRVRKVRPAARVGRRKWRVAALAAVAASSLTAASTAHAQTWNGTTADYNTDGNWSPNGAPIAQGQSASFANTGSAAVDVSAQITPDAWTFAPNAQSYTITGAGVNFGGAGITNNAAASTTISIANAIGGTGGVTQAGAGVLTLSGVNTYTGGTNVSGGTLIAQNTGNAFGSSGTVAISAGATVELNVTGSNFYTQAPNTFTGAGTIEKTGTGSLTLGGNGGNTNISLSQGGLINVLGGTLGGSSSGQGIWTNNKGSLNVAAGAILNTVEAAVFIDALTGAGTYQSGYAGPRTTTIGVAGGTGTFSGTIQDAGGNDRAVIVKTGAGTQTFSGANTYTGGTTFAGGFLNAGSAGALGSAGTLSFTGGTLQYSAANQTDYSGRFSTAANQTYSIDTNGQAITYATALTSSGGSLTKLGTGTLTLSGDSSYTGATTISGGTLQIGNGATGSIAGGSAISIAGGAGLVLNKADGYTILNGVSGAGALTVQGATNSGNLVTFSGALTQTGGFTVADASNVRIAATGSYTGGTQVELNGGAFTNLGAIDTRSSTFVGTVEGIRINASGTVTNGATGATVQARQSGITSVGTATTTVNNYGLVVGRDFAGVGSLSAQSAITINNLNGTAAGTGGIIYGQGSVDSGWGAFNNAGGALTVTNESAAKIVGTIYGVYGTGAATSVTNAGTIASGTYDTGTGVITVGGMAGIQLDAGGTVTNQTNGQILGGGARGITSNAGLSLTNLGTISGTNDGVGALGGASSVLNAGTISSSTNSGVAVGGAGATLTVTNATGGTINGGSDATFGYGLGANGQAMTVNNYGSIGSGARGVTAFNDGTVTANLYAGSSTGSILGSGGNDTVSLYTGVFNQAVVTTPYTDAVTGAPSTVTLQNSGAVAAATVGTINLGGGNNTLNLRGTGTYDGVTGANTTGARGALDISTVSGLTTLNKQDSGIFVLTGAYDGALTTNVTGGSLIAQNTGDAFGSSGTVAISSGATVELNNTTGTSVLQAGNTFNGAGTIAKTGTGRVDLGGFGTVTVALAANGLIDVREGTLAGSNNFQGIWTDNKGSLNIESGATFDGVEGTIIVNRLTGAGTLQGGFEGTRTTTIGIADGTDTFSGTIQNSDNTSNPTAQLALTKAGTGTQTLSGSSTYSGVTTISGGTLKAGSTTGFSANSAFTVAAATTLDLGGFSNTVGALAGAGTVTNSGTAAATLTTGGLAQSPTFSGIIQNGNATTALTKTGGGTLTLTGANTYTGGTTIAGGTLQLGNGGATGSIIGNVTNNGTLAFARSDTSTFGNAVSGTGAVNQIGAGTTIVTASNSYTGGTTISAGTLQLGNGGTTGAITGNVVDNANLAFNRSDVATFSGAISGTGNVQHNGSGTTILTGASTYTGSTVINAGTLQVDGSIFSPNLTVNNGGTLSGIGKIGDPLIAAGGTLAPGNAANPYGTITIGGPLTFSAGSYYNVNITPTANSRTNVVGATNLQGGTVRVMAGAGVYSVNTNYTILTSTGGVTGRFAAAVATNLAFLAPTLSYGANDVVLTLVQAKAFRTAALTSNQGAVAGGLDNGARTIAANSNGSRLVGALNQLTAPQARAAFDGLSGEGITAAQNVAQRSAQLFTSSIFDQTVFYASAPSANSVTLFDAAPIRELADLPSRKAQPTMPAVPNRTWRAWASGYGGVDDIHGSAATGSATQQNTIYGGTLGVDYQLTPNYLVGVALGGSNGDFAVRSRGTSGSSTGGHIAIYDLATFGSFYGASSSSFSYFGNRTNRFVAGFGGLGNESERGNFNSNELRTRLEFGRHFAGQFGLGSAGVVTPFVALELAQLRSNGFTESAVQGAGLYRLNVSGQSAASAPAFVGVRLQRATSIGSGITLSPTLQVAYVHEFAPYRSQVATLADLPGSTFLVDGAMPGRNAAQVKAGAELSVGQNWVAFANFDGEFSGVNQFYAGKGGVRMGW